jgi:UDP-N-acetylmuramate dehydrogenase
VQLPVTSAIEQAAAILGGRARRHVPIGPLTTYRVGGAAALFLEARDENDLHIAADAVTASQVPVLVVGRGSNLLVADSGFAGLAITLGEAFTHIELLPNGRVRAGGAVQLPVLARRTAAAGLAGLEWAVGVPGSVGGAVRMNAGGHGADTASTLVRCRLLDLNGDEAVERDVADLEFAYRHSVVSASQVVVWGEYGLQPGDRAASEEKIDDIVRWRREHQPGGQNAGSVFTNPPDDSAGRLIDAAGLKGLRVGSAQVSEKHANFIQADDAGSADDVRALILEVQREVMEKTGIHLHPELRMVGWSE